MNKSLQGVIHGKTIELETDPGLADGQPVEVTVRIPLSADQRASLQGLRRCAGALANSWRDSDERILDEIHQERKMDSRQEIER